MKTKGELEAEVSNAVIRFKREYMGRGPQDVRTYLLDDMALVRLKGVLTPAEQRLAQVERAVSDILGVDITSLHTDISTRTGESIILFTLNGKPPYKPT